MSKELKPVELRNRSKKYDDLLFGTEDSASDSPYQEISLNLIDPPTNQPRRFFDPQKMQELTESIQKFGVSQPILIRPVTGGRYELIYGERRYRACQQLERSTIPAMVKVYSDEETQLLRLVENLHRAGLNPVEEAEAILHILAIKLAIEPDEVAKLLYKMRHDKHKGEDDELTLHVKETFNELGLIKWETFIANRLSLLSLPDDVIAVIREGRIEYTKALAIGTVKDDTSRAVLLENAIAQNLSLTEIRERIHQLKLAQVDTNPSVPTVKSKLATSYLKLKKSKEVWQDKKKVKAIEKLINQIEALLEESESDLHSNRH